MRSLVAEFMPRRPLSVVQTMSASTITSSVFHSPACTWGLGNAPAPAGLGDAGAGGFDASSCCSANVAGGGGEAGGGGRPVRPRARRHSRELRGGSQQTGPAQLFAFRVQRQLVGSGLAEG